MWQHEIGVEFEELLDTTVLEKLRDAGSKG